MKAIWLGDRWLDIPDEAVVAVGPLRPASDGSDAYEYDVTIKTPIAIAGAAQGILRDVDTAR